MKKRLTSGATVAGAEDVTSIRALRVGTADTNGVILAVETAVRKSERRRVGLGMGRVKIFRRFVLQRGKTLCGFRTRFIPRWTDPTASTLTTTRVREQEPTPGTHATRYKGTQTNKTKNQK